LGTNNFPLFRILLGAYRGYIITQFYELGGRNLAVLKRGIRLKFKGGAISKGAKRGIFPYIRGVPSPPW